MWNFLSDSEIASIKLFEYNTDESNGYSAKQKLIKAQIIWIYEIKSKRFRFSFFFM